MHLKKGLCIVGMMSLMLSAGGAFASQFIVTLDSSVMPVVKGMSVGVSGSSERKMFTSSVMNAASVMAESAGGRSLKVYGNLVKDGNVMVLMKTDGDDAAFVELLKKSDGVKSVAPDVRVYGQATLFGQDENDELEELKKNSLPAIDAESGDLTASGAVVYVADTGADVSQSEIAELVDMENSYNFNTETPQAGDSIIQDYHGHGSHVLGIIAGRNTVRGVGRGAKVRVAKVLDKNDSGNTSMIVDFLNTLNADTSFSGVRVINMSLAGFFDENPDTMMAKYPNSDFPLYDAMRMLSDTGKFVFVVAAGNHGVRVGVPMESDDPKGHWKAGEYIIPASFRGISGMVTVASYSHRSNTVSKFTDWSPEFVDFQAPGEKIFSYWSTKSSVAQPTGFASGTSMAAPHVVGVIAAVSATNPELKAAQIIDIVRHSVKADPLMMESGLAVCRYGTPSLAKAVRAAGDVTPDPDEPPAPTPTPTPTPNPTPDFIIDMDKNPDASVFEGQPIGREWGDLGKWHVVLGSKVEAPNSGDVSVSGRKIKVFTELRPILKPLTTIEIKTAGWYKDTNKLALIEVKNDSDEWIDDTQLLFRHVLKDKPYVYRITHEGIVLGDFYDAIDYSPKSGENDKRDVNLTLASVTGLMWVREGDSVKTIARFGRTGLAVIDMPGAPKKPEYDNDLNLLGGGGCDAGFGVGGLILLLGAFAVTKKNAA